MKNSGGIPSTLFRKMRKSVRNLPNLLQGYNIYVNRDKLGLIEQTFETWVPNARSFADLGGVWKVNGAYSVHAMRCSHIEKGYLVDWHIPPSLLSSLSRYPGLRIIEGDFTSEAVLEAIGTVDVIFLFDVLLHQANPDWDQVLERCCSRAQAVVIYNQQYVRGDRTLRLTDLALEDYIAIASDHALRLTRQVYEHPADIHPLYRKPWKDIHTITQWGITDAGLRTTMERLGFHELWCRNYGAFINLPAFENHAFVFSR